MPDNICIKDLLNSDEPLSAEALELLINHKEEDLFDDKNEKY
jgi:hypothetical protein